MNALRPLPVLSLVALLTVLVGAPLSGRGPADQKQPQTGQPAGQNRQGPRPNRTPSEVGWEWWRDQAVIKELNLAPDKAKRIDGFYLGRQRQLKPYVEEWLKQQEELNKMTVERVVDPDTYALQVSRVEALRGKLYESRAVMLYRIYRELSPEQYQKLREISDRRRNRGGNEPR